MGKFALGELVYHRRYAYRGVVYGVDPRCMAEDDWYFANRTQPDREQPWYRVLVDGGWQTYVAQENLDTDTKGTPVDHPYVDQMFFEFAQGRYWTHSRN